MPTASVTPALPIEIIEKILAYCDCEAFCALINAHPLFPNLTPPYLVAEHVSSIDNGRPLWPARETKDELLSYVFERVCNISQTAARVRAGTNLITLDDPIDTARFSRDGRYVITKISRGGLECALVSDIRDPDPTRFVFDTKFASEVKLSNDGRYICIAGGLKAGVYDLMGDRPQFVGFKDCRTSWYQFSSDDKYLVARINRNSRHFGVWDMQTAPPRRVLDTAGMPSFVGRQLVKIRHHRPNQKENEERLEFINVTTHDPDSVTVVVSSDRSALVISEDERILCYFRDFLVVYDMSKSLPRLLDLTTGGQRLYPVDVGVAPNSAFLWARLGHGEPLRFWDLRHGTPRPLGIEWPAGPVKDVVFSGRGRYMLTRPFTTQDGPPRNDGQGTGTVNQSSRQDAVSDENGTTNPNVAMVGNTSNGSAENRVSRNGRVSPVDSVVDQQTLGEIWDISGRDGPGWVPRLIARTPLSLPPRDGVSENLDKLHDVLIFSPNERFLASITGGGVDLWNLSTGQHWELKNDLGYYCTGGTFSPDSKHFETEHGVDFRKRDIWDLRPPTGPRLVSLVRPDMGKRSRWSSSSFSGNGRYLCTRTYDKGAVNQGHAIWDLHTKECIIVNDDYNCNGRSSPDGRFLLEFNGKKLEIIDLLLRSRRRSSASDSAILDEI